MKKNTKNGKMNTPQKINKNTWVFRGYKIIKHEAYKIYNKSGKLVITVDNFFFAHWNIKELTKGATA